MNFIIVSIFVLIPPYFKLLLVLTNSSSNIVFHVD